MEFKKDRKIMKSRFSLTTKHMRRTNRLVEDLHSLYQSERFSDVTLHCGTEIFRVHKNILSARSPVFAAMFLNPMKESHQDYVNIQGIEPNVLSSMLQYIYCCSTKPMNASLACQILSAADMYQIPDLKDVCVDFLRYVMCEENVLHIIRIADLYDEKLRSEAAKFICENYDSIERKTEWKTLQADKPHLVIEIMALKIDSLRCNDDHHSDTEMKLVPATKRRNSERSVDITLSDRLGLKKIEK